MTYYALPRMTLRYNSTEPELPSIQSQMWPLYELATVLGDSYEELDTWYLSQGSSVKESLQYEAFDSTGPAMSALAVLREQFRREQDIRAIALWNGAEKEEAAASLVSRCVSSRMRAFNEVALSLTLAPALDDWRIPARWLSVAAKLWPLSMGGVAPLYHADFAVFKDRPGVGWMLYLPVLLDSQKVPEARALELVHDEKGEAIGTILVSVVDEPYSDANPEHVQVANSIAIRLVDLGVL